MWAVKYGSDIWASSDPRKLRAKCADQLSKKRFDGGPLCEVERADPAVLEIMAGSGYIIHNLDKGI